MYITISKSPLSVSVCEYYIYVCVVQTVFFGRTGYSLKGPTVDLVTPAISTHSSSSFSPSFHVPYALLTSNGPDEGNSLQLSAHTYILFLSTPPASLCFSNKFSLALKFKCTSVVRQRGDLLLHQSRLIFSYFCSSTLLPCSSSSFFLTLASPSTSH